MSIEVKDLVHIYLKGSKFEKPALKGVNLTIEDGEFLGIMGQTGSGKSTLVQHFNGLLKPTTGTVTVNGLEVTGKNLKELRRQVGVVFQYPEYQLFEETVYKDIAFGLRKLGYDSETADNKIKKAIQAVGLPESILDKSPFELSGGQKRRVAIAGVLVMEPQVLVLDEPAAGLDPSGRDEILGRMKELHENLGITVILVSHRMEDIARYTKRAIVMADGEIALDGKVRDVFARTEKLEALGLSLPQVSVLGRRLEAAFPGFNGKFLTVEEAKDEILRYLKNEPGVKAT